MQTNEVAPSSRSRELRSDEDTWYDLFSDDWYDGIHRLDFSHSNSIPAVIPRRRLGNAMEDSRSPGGNSHEESWYDRFSDDSSYDTHISLKETHAMVPASRPRLDPTLANAPGDWYDAFQDDSSYDSHIMRKNSLAMPPRVDSPALGVGALDAGLAETELVVMAPPPEDLSADDATGGNVSLLTVVLLPCLGTAVLFLLFVWLMRRRRQTAKTSELPVVMPTTGSEAAFAAPTIVVVSNEEANTKPANRKPPSTKPALKRVRWILKPSISLRSGRLCLQRVPRPTPTVASRSAAMHAAAAAPTISSTASSTTTSSINVFSS